MTSLPPTSRLPCDRRPGMVVGSMSGGHKLHETGVLNGLKWVFLALGLISVLLFALEPDIHAHPELVLMGFTGLLGALSLRALSGIMGPGSDIDLR